MSCKKERGCQNKRAFIIKVLSNGVLDHTNSKSHTIRQELEGWDCGTNDSIDNDAL